MDMLDEDGAALELTPDELVSLWQSTRGGLVLSGGEPFSQAAGLAEVCREVRGIEQDTPILVYTGYRLDELIDAGWQQWFDLLRHADVIVDGLFVESRTTDMPLVGSDNQRIILLGERVPPERLTDLRQARIQSSLDADGNFGLVGTGAAGLDMNALVATMRDQGLGIED
jgi:organic radical activating enzyme